jgi:uncharacterized protein YcaQ
VDKNRVYCRLEQARCFYLQKQLLRNPQLPEKKAGIYEVIKKLGYVQIDTINVIERSHHIVLFTRCPDYKQKYLHVLHAQDKKIFEYWAHAASFIPMKDYRFYIRAIEKKPKEDSWLNRWINEHRGLIQKVRKRVERDGPLTASDFADLADRKRGTWWDWKPAKMALEVLFWQGVLMIKERRNFQRVYDITERVLPKNTNTIKPTIDEEKKFFITRALGALGIATVKDINSYIGIGGKLNEWVHKMLKTKEIIEIEINEIKKPYYILSRDIPELHTKRKTLSTQVHFLSPFDNSIILRDRTSTLFKFNYSLECYVPKNKRIYGYFCLPILWQNQLVGRIDPKVERQNKILHINNLYFEDKKVISKEFMDAFAQSLLNFSRFHDCRKIEFNKKIPTKITKTILKHY